MESKDYFLLSAVIFLLVSILHLIRAINLWRLDVGPVIIPIWVSWAVVVVALILAWHGFKLGKRGKTARRRR